MPNYAAIRAELRRNLAQTILQFRANCSALSGEHPKKRTKVTIFFDKLTDFEEKTVKMFGALQKFTYFCKNYHTNHY